MTKQERKLASIVVMAILGPVILLAAVASILPRPVVTDLGRTRSMPHGTEEIRGGVHYIDGREVRPSSEQPFYKDPIGHQ